jgi:hypothetical protein
VRVNKSATLAKLPVLSDRAPKKMRGNTFYEKRIKHPDEAKPATNDLWQREVYQPGNGEQTQPIRAGSQDAMKLPSKGFST